MPDVFERSYRHVGHRGQHRDGHDLLGADAGDEKKNGDGEDTPTDAGRRLKGADEQTEYEQAGSD